MPDHATLICEEVLVNPQFRGHGIGGKIMADFVEFAKEREQKIYRLRLPSSTFKTIPNLPA